MDTQRSSVRSFLILISFLTVFGASLHAPAAPSAALNHEQPYRVGTASSGLGGAGRAATDAVEAGWLNPAALVHVRSYHFAASSQQSRRDNGDGYRDGAIMLADGGEEKLASGSFSYIQRSTLRAGPGGVSAEQKDFQGSLAMFVPGTRASIGATYRRLIHAQSGADLTQDTYTVGFLMPLTQELGLAVVGQDLAGGSGAAEPEARIVPSIAFGLHAGLMSILQLRADLSRPIRDVANPRNDIRVGIESWFRPDFAFRLGGAWLENRDEMWLTTGLGFRGPRLSFGYSFEKELRSSDGTRHTFDLWMPL